MSTPAGSMSVSRLSGCQDDGGTVRTTTPSRVNRPTRPSTSKVGQRGSPYRCAKSGSGGTKWVWKSMRIKIHFPERTVVRAGEQVRT
jgi:hypothetical protein